MDSLKVRAAVWRGALVQLVVGNKPTFLHLHVALDGTDCDRVAERMDLGVFASNVPSSPAIQK